MSQLSSLRNVAPRAVAANASNVAKTRAARMRRTIACSTALSCRALTILLNLLLGFIPTLILGASIAAGVDDDAGHRRVFLLIYGLWAFTLAGWNWLESSHVAWIVLWALFGAVALTLWLIRRR
jgi:hypothetical protein